MYKKLFCLLSVYISLSISNAKANEDIQLNYVLKQLCQALKSGNENSLQELISDDFTLSIYKAGGSKKATS